MNGCESRRDIVNMIAAESDREARFRRFPLGQCGIGGLDRSTHLDYWDADNLASGFVHMADKAHYMVADCHNRNMQVVGSFVVGGAVLDETGRHCVGQVEAKEVRGLIEIADQPCQLRHLRGLLESQRNEACRLEAEELLATATICPEGLRCFGSHVGSVMVHQLLVAGPEDRTAVGYWPPN